MAARLGDLFTGLVYAGLAALAVRLLGDPVDDAGLAGALWAARVLRLPCGGALLIAAGAVTIGAGVGLAYRAGRGAVAHRLERRGMRPMVGRAIVGLARAGSVARAVLFGVVGALLVRAGWRHDVRGIGGLGEALDVLDESRLGPVLVACTGAGCLAYGLYQLAKARFRRLTLPLTLPAPRARSHGRAPLRSGRGAVPGRPGMSAHERARPTVDGSDRGAGLRASRAWLLVVLALAPLVARPLDAQPSGSLGDVLGDARATVRLDGRPLFRVGPTDSTTAAARARRIERRLGTLLETPTAITPARVERVARAGATAGATGDERAVTIAGVPVVTVTRADAEDHLATLDALAAQWARAVDVELARAAARRLSPGARFAAEVRASVATAFSRLLEAAIRLVPRALAATLVLLLFWAIAAAVRRLLRLVFARVIEDRTVENLIRQVAYYAIWALGLVLAVAALGFEPETVVTGLGLTSLALGFALKDVLSNFVAGVLLLLQRPFRLGDQIVVGDVEGSVERIRLRATDIRTYDGRLVLVPNAELFGSRVTNNTASPMRRAAVPFFVGYEADLRQAAAAVGAAVRAIAGVLDDPAPVVRVRELGQDDAVLEARFWTDSRRADFTATQALVRDAIVEALRGAGIALPDPDARFLVPRDPARWRAALGSPAPGSPAPGSPASGTRSADASEPERHDGSQERSLGAATPAAPRAVEPGARQADGPPGNGIASGR